MTDEHKFLYRPHRGGLEEAMKEVVELSSWQALVEHVKQMWPVKDDGSNLVVKWAIFDDRIEWDTYMVTVDGNIIGWTNAPVRRPA